MRCRTRGQALVETAIVLWVLLIPMLFAIFDFGMVLADWVNATSAASVGARQAAIGACFDDTTCAVTSVVDAVMQSAPLLSAGDDGTRHWCQNPPSPAAAFECALRVDVALVDNTAGSAACDAVEIWTSRQFTQSGSTTTVLHSSTTTWAANSLVGSLVVFTSGPDANASGSVVSNSGSTITVSPAFATPPGIGDAFQVNATRIASTAIVNMPCSATPAAPNINDMVSVVVHTRAELPVGLPFLPTTMDIQNSSTIRYEGALVP